MALPIYTVKVFFSRVSLGSFASSEVSECQEVCEALATERQLAIAQECARCSASSAAGQGNLKSRCVLIMVDSPGTPAHREMPFEPLKLKSSD